MLIDSVNLVSDSTIQNAVIESGSSYPSSGSVGELFYNTTTSVLGMYNGSSWAAINQSQIQSMVATAIQSVVNGAPTAFDTLVEIATQLAADESAATTLANVVASKASVASLSTVATTGSYSDLSNKPSIPTTVSALTNDSAYQTLTQVNSAIQAVVGAAPTALDTLVEIAAQLANDESAVSALVTTVSTKAATSSLAAVATTGTFASLTSKPTTLAGYGITDATGNNYNDVAGMILGKPSNSQQVLRYVAGRACTLPSNMTGSIAKAGTAAAASSVFSIQKNGSQFSTMTFAAAGTVATWGTCSATSFAVGDILTIIAPASVDSTLADVGMTLLGTLS
jgi:hypothetical protein